ncbi:g6084 [Coccomyxa elongata]
MPRCLRARTPFVPALLTLKAICECDGLQHIRNSLQAERAPKREKKVVLAIAGFEPTTSPSRGLHAKQARNLRPHPSTLSTTAALVL